MRIFNDRLQVERSAAGDWVTSLLIFVCQNAGRLESENVAFRIESKGVEHVDPQKLPQKTRFCRLWPHFL
jgi:hypothetical protein